MNAIDKIINESKTNKQAAERLQAWVNRIYPDGQMATETAAKFVKDYKAGRCFVETQAMLDAEKRYNREQTRLSLESKTPIDMINKAIAYKDEQLAQFFEKASKDPYYQFSWGDAAVKTAAQRKVYLEIREWLSTPTSLERWQEIIKYISGEALQMASSPARSTSPMSNFAESCLMEAKANIARNWDHTIGEIGYWFKEKAAYDAGEEE